MRLNKLFIGDIYILNKKNFKLGPSFAPLSLSSDIYDIKFIKRTLLYKKNDYAFIDLCVDNNTEIKDSNKIHEVNENENFVMVNDNLICIGSELLNRGIKRRHISKCRVKKMVSKVK